MVFLVIGQGFHHLKDVLLAVANVNFVINNKNGTTQKGVMFQNVFFEIGLGQGFVFQIHRFVKLCFFTEKGFIASGKMVHFFQFFDSDWVLFDVMKLQIMVFRQGFDDFSTGITRSEVVYFVHNGKDNFFVQRKFIYNGK